MNKIDFRGADLDAKIAFAEVLDSLRVARQVAYVHAKMHPCLQETFEAAEAQYRAFAERLGVDTKPVFDEAEHIRQRLTEGNRDYLEAYGDNPRFASPRR